MITESFTHIEVLQLQSLLGDFVININHKKAVNETIMHTSSQQMSVNDVLEEPKTSSFLPRDAYA